MIDDFEHPLTEDDLQLLTTLEQVQAEFDPIPEGMLDRISFAVSLELMHAELATLADESLALSRAETSIPADTLTFTASSTSLMVVLTEIDEGVRIDGWVTGGGVTVELHAGSEVHSQVSDATGRLTWSRVAHGSIRFLVRPSREGARPVVTPTIEV